MTRTTLIVFCGLLLGLNAFSNDILLPAFSEISGDLRVPMASVQSLIPLFLIAAGIGQLLFGPLSDRFGRRPLILVGLVIFLAGAFICLEARSIGALQLGRMLQGAGSACGVVVARAVLRDTNSGEALARTMALAMTIFAFGPVAAPLCGVAAMAIGGWRATFVVVAVVAGTLAIAAFVMFRETLEKPDPTATDVAAIVDAGRRMLAHPQSRYFLALACIVQFTIISMVSNSPVLFRQTYGIEGTRFALLLGLAAIGIIAGQLLNHRLIMRFGVLSATRLAAGVLAADALAVLVLASTGFLPLPVFVMLLMMFSASFLVLMANAISLVLEPHKDIAGRASSIYGCATQLSGSIMALLTFRLFGGEIIPWACGF